MKPPEMMAKAQGARDVHYALAWEDYEEAWGLLDVAGQDVNDGDDAHKALETYATRGPEESARAGLALALATGDGLLDVTWSTDWTRARLHLEFLQRHGYVLSDAERQELGQNAAEENSEPRRGSSTGGPLPADWLPGPGG